MSTELSRWVVVDDMEDTQIRYTGDWMPSSGSDYNTRGNFGQVYRSRLHGASTTGARLSFTFTGNAARIMGTTDLAFDSAGGHDPNWQCILDGRVVPSEPPFRYPQNNWLFCRFYELQAGEHTIELVVQTRGRTFWFDQIQYRPTVPVSNAVIAVTRDDADLVYSGAWRSLANVGHFAASRGSSATFRFTGTAITLYAMYANELARGEGQATFTVDDGAPRSFIVPGGGSMSVYNRRIMEVTGLSQGPHTITFTNEAQSGQTPLVIAQLFVENGSNIRAPRSSSPGGNSNDDSTSGASFENNAPGASTTSPSSEPADVIPDLSDVGSLAGEAGSNSTSGVPNIGNGTPDTQSFDASATGLADPSSDLGQSGEDSASESGMNVGAIVGGALGGLAAIIIIVLLIWYQRKRRAGSRHQPPSATAFSYAPQSTPATFAQNPFTAHFASTGIPANAPASPNGQSSNAYPRDLKRPASSSINNASDIGSPYYATNVDADTTSSTNLISGQLTGDSNDNVMSAHAAPSMSAVLSLGGSSQSGLARTIYHEDSGVRGAEIVFEHPPRYTRD